ncbi:MAG: bifunctional oligoribonuclease/PAP phosphatase NrnA [candidate division WOR-3 bacterium]
MTANNMEKRLTNSWTRLKTTIKTSKNILIATHIDPDGDGICSALLMAHLVNFYKRKKPTLFCHSPIPEKYQFLLHNDRFSNTLTDFDLLIAVDSANIERIFPKGKYSSDFLKRKLVINIDHHRSNKLFGAITIIDEKASSACEIIYRLFKKLNLPINRQVAQIFYAGIYMETGGFVYPNTTASALQICSELIKKGVEPAQLIKRLNAKTVEGTKLLAEVLSTIEIEHGVGTMYLSQAMLKKHRASMSESENFISFLQAIRDVRVSLFLREEKDDIRVSLRSDGIIDVNKFAQRFGGGGHRLAAGMRLKGSIKAVKKKLLTELIKEL